MDKVLRTAVCGQTFVDKVLWTEVCDKVLWTTVCGQAFVDKDLWTAVCLRLQFAVWMQKPDASKLSPCIHLVFAAFVITLSASRPRFFPNLSALLSALFPQRVRAFFHTVPASTPQPQVVHTMSARFSHHVRKLSTWRPQDLRSMSASFSTLSAGSPHAVHSIRNCPHHVRELGSERCLK